MHVSAGNIKRYNMKKILPIASLIVLFAACKQNKDLEVKQNVVSADTSALYMSNASTDAGKFVQATPVVPSEPKEKVRIVYVDRPVIKEVKTEQKPVEQKQSPQAGTVSTPSSTPPISTTRDSTSTAGAGSKSGPVAGSAGNTGKETTTTAPSKEVKKKGWSTAAKGAVIGGVGGAVVGAVLSKNKAKGAVIGGVVGAVGGYIFGRSKDKQNGRLDAQNILAGNYQ
jgi:hypothetical protein